MRNRCWIIRIAVCWLFVIAGIGAEVQGAAVTVVLPQVKSERNAEVKVPIRVKDADGLGPLQMELLFDSQQMKFLTAIEGAQFSVGLFDFNLIEPGRLRLVMTGDPGKPINGDGELFILTFEALATATGSIALTAEKVKAWEQTLEAHDMRVTVEPGSVEISPQKMPFLMIPLGVFGLILVLAVVARMFRKTPKVGADSTK